MTPFTLVSGLEIVTVSQYQEFYDKSRKTPYLVAIVKIPEELYSPIISVQKELRAIDSRQLYCPPNYFHITLKMIGSLGGSIDQNKLPKIIAGVERAAEQSYSFRLEFRGLGIFPDVIYLGIKEGEEELRKLHLSLINELHDLAIPGRFEGPQMTPHVTLLTFVTKDVEALLEKVKSMDRVDIPSMIVDRIALIRSYPYRMLDVREVKELVNEEIVSFELPQQ